MPVERSARISIDSACKSKDFAFSRRPFCVAADYFSPHQSETIDLSPRPIVRFPQPCKPRAVKLPIDIIIPAVVEGNYHGQIGRHYPFRGLAFLAHHTVGLV
jgi:hypothetical protein